MKKYFEIWSLEWKNALVYRGDALLSAVFGMAAVLLSYLLWKAVFAGAETFDSFTFPEMMTYYLLSRLMFPLTQGEGILHDFSAEIKSGVYSKYIVKPISPLIYYISASLSRGFLPALISAVAFVCSMLLFPSVFVPIALIDLLCAIPVILVGILFNYLIYYLISLATFKFTDISFIFIIENIIYGLLAGAILPLNLLLGDKLTMFSPFSYMVYYPVMLTMGKTEVPWYTAAGVLSLWTAVLLFIVLSAQKRAPKMFEGVGI